MDINNKTVVVTGAGSGMGAATAMYLAKQGAQCVLLDAQPAAAEQVAAEVQGLAVTADVSDAQQVAAAMQAAVAKYQAIHAVINCAGIAPAARIVGKQGPQPLAEFEKVIQVNLIGTFNVMRIVAAQMMQQDPVNADGERGVIINTASVAAYEGQIGQAAYSASKGGVVAMTMPAARELSQFGIRVMTIAPGIIATPMMQAMPEKVQQSLAEAVPFPKRLGAASEYAALVAHIISNAYLNGEVIRLDGAIRMAPK